MHMYKTTLLHAFATPIQFHVSTVYMYTPTDTIHNTGLNTHVQIQLQFHQYRYIVHIIQITRRSGKTQKRKHSPKNLWKIPRNSKFQKHMYTPQIFKNIYLFLERENKREERVSKREGGSLRKKRRKKEGLCPSHARPAHGLAVSPTAPGRRQPPSVRGWLLATPKEGRGVEFGCRRRW